ncbi:flagellin N-terminal helical domain-containing protein [Candidatus Laterigemmans baculatus]|uniref:flagellin N-terminal helical domain-containing protein n=1 Tax=Candidatus Laterigemmans baculatus TaxID=2770505 RepID=UPI0013DABAFD|nr:flagellar hook protein [Candidatus Laterigemmans baculatus]
MSLLPVVTPRTSTPLQHQRLVYQVHADQVGLQRLYDQLSTGRRVLSPSDDPTAAARALSYQQGVDYSEQLVRNTKAASGYLQSVDTAMASIDDGLIEARAIAVGAAQGVLAEGERETLAGQLDQVLARLMSVGNQAFRDHSLIGGALTSKPPLRWENGTIVYSGNEAVAQAEIAPGTAVATLPTGDDALGLAAPRLKSKELAAGLTAETRLVDTRDGRGMQPGILRLSGGGDWTEIDLRGSVTMGDVASRIEGVVLDGRELAVDISGDAVTIRYADGLHGTLAISDAPGSELAKQMKISNPQGIAPPPIVGAGLAPRTTTATRLSDLDDGAGLDLQPGFQIVEGDETFEVDLSTAETVDDVLLAINHSGAAVRAELDPTTSKLQLRLLKSGVTYSIGESGGMAATRLGLRSAGGETRLDSLRNGRGAGLSGDARPDLTIVRPDGVSLDINAEGLSTIDDVIAAINAHPDNQDAAQVTAALSAHGNGITLQGASGTGGLEIRQNPPSELGNTLGLIPSGQDAVVGSSEAGNEVVRGADYAPVESGGALDTLLRLRDAVLSGDVTEIERLSQRLDADFDQANRTRGMVGYRLQSVDLMQARAEDQAVLMKSRMSEEIDAEFTSMVSEITRRQMSLDASLRLMGQTSGLTVLNFL